MNTQKLYALVAALEALGLDHDTAFELAVSNYKAVKNMLKVSSKTMNDLVTAAGVSCCAVDAEAV